MSSFDDLVEEYPAWWIDFLGEHNHVGGIESTRWLFERSGLGPGKMMVDCGAFVGAAARFARERTGCEAVALDVNPDFLIAGRALPAGEGVRWLAASNHRLPFDAETFDSAWCLDSYLAPKELSRVTKRAGATLCLCGELPVDNRGGLESFIEEFGGYGWELAGHKQLTFEALHQWRLAEAALVAKRSYYEPRYGKRAYLAQLDLLASMVQAYERGETGHGLLVFKR